MRAVEISLPSECQDICDLDWKVGGHWAAVRNIEDQGFEVFTSSWRLALQEPIRFPMIRLINESQVVVVGARTPRGTLNGWVVTHGLGVTARFYAGDAISTVDVVGSRVVIGYFDEACGSAGVEGEGISAFSILGATLWGYRTGYRNSGINIVDVYGAFAEESGIYWALIYPESKLLKIDFQQHQYQAYSTPKACHGAHGVACIDGVFYLSGAYGNRSVLQKWKLGAPRAEVVGECVGEARGVGPGIFLVNHEGGYRVVHIE